MRAAITALAVIAILAGTLTASAAQTNAPVHGSAIVAPPDPCARHPRPAAEQRELAGSVFALWRWRHPAPGGRAIAAMKVLRGCADRRTRKKMAAAWHRGKKSLKLEHEYRGVATEPGWTDGSEGRFLRYLPLPKYVVACETRGLRREAKWLAVGDEGALGPAQLNGWGAPYPAARAAEKVEYWKLAAYVLAVQGMSAWSCAS